MVLSLIPQINYGLFPLGSQTLKANINGEEKVHINVDGEVGINFHDNPSEKLQLMEVSELACKTTAVNEFRQ